MSFEKLECYLGSGNTQWCLSGWWSSFLSSSVNYPELSVLIEPWDSMWLSKSGLILLNRRYFLPSQLDFPGLSKEAVYARTQETWLTHYIFLAQGNQSNYLCPLTSCLRIAHKPWSGFVIFRSFGIDQQVKLVFGDTTGFPICSGTCRGCAST